MKKYIALFLSSALLLLSTQISVAWTDVQGKTIKAIAVGWAGEGLYVTLNEPYSPVEGCVDQRLYIPPTAPMFKENMSILLSAFHANTKVTFQVIGCFASFKVHQFSSVYMEK